MTRPGRCELPCSRVDDVSGVFRPDPSLSDLARAHDARHRTRPLAERPVCGAITASTPSWTAPFTGRSPLLQQAGDRGATRNHQGRRAVGHTTTIADGGHQGTGLVIPQLRIKTRRSRPCRLPNDGTDVSRDSVAVVEWPIGISDADLGENGEMNHPV
ncbi:hypothetical protein GCM10010343_08850 [Streptomyces avidinii]|nr:hypothetical protein GCM10010343_08850 [Streptomyces avidinii]